MTAAAFPSALAPRPAGADAGWPVPARLLALAGLGAFLWHVRGSSPGRARGGPFAATRIRLTAR
ncbi:hypothetical protein BH23PSE1_BH23PSE1_14870 [soil metagenome]